jgi:uncharacterized protein (DUF2141 family)
MAKGKKGQHRQTVISNTAQWPKEKTDKMTNSDQQYSTMTKGKQGQNRQTVISKTAQWPKEKKDKIDKQ